MADGHVDGVVDSLTLRFIGEDENGEPIHELRAAHVAEVLQGVVALASDFDKAGVFGADGTGGSEVLVRAAKEGSFLIEIIRVIGEEWGPLAAVTGVPSLSTVIWWATKSARAGVRGFDYLDNGNVKITWQDDTAEEVPVAAWHELQKRSPRRKKQLRQIMAPLSDAQVSSLEVAGVPGRADADTPDDEVPAVHVLTRPDYDAVKPDSEVEVDQDFFEVEGQMSAIDFDDPTKWKVKIAGSKARTAKVEDQEFLLRIAEGLAIRKSDIFRVRVREDVTRKNGRTRTVWTVLHVESYRRAAGDED